MSGKLFTSSIVAREVSRAVARSGSCGGFSVAGDTEEYSARAETCCYAPLCFVNSLGRLSRLVVWSMIADQ
jgi:hypothetical protein